MTYHSDLMQNYLFTLNNSVFDFMKKFGGSKGLFEEQKLIDYVFTYGKIDGGTYKSKSEVKHILKDLVENSFLQTQKVGKKTYYFYTKKSWERLYNSAFNQQILLSLDVYKVWDNKIKFLETNIKNFHNPEIKNIYDFNCKYPNNTFFNFNDVIVKSILYSAKIKDNKEIFVKILRSLNGLGFKLLGLNSKLSSWVLFPLNVNSNSEFIQSINNALKKGIKQIEMLTYDESGTTKNSIIVACPIKYKDIVENQKRTLLINALNQSNIKTTEDLQSILNLSKTKIIFWYY